MGTAGIGLIECYRAFGDIKYFNAAKLITDFIYNNPPYPHQWYSDPYRYYGNPNNIAEGLRLLSHFYQLVGDQKYLDLALQIAEELFSWQDYKHNSDPWQEPGSTNGNWDGSWYWYMYAPDPLPPGCIPNGNPVYNGRAADRRMWYHCITLDGIIKFAQTIEQQRLLGTTTIRNNLSSQQFRNNIVNSIVRATNYIIDNQETVNSGSSKFRGLVKGMKWYRNYNANFGPNYSTYEYSTQIGLGTLSNSLLYLQKTGILTTGDLSNLNSIINSISSKLITVRNMSFYVNDDYAVVMNQWNQYIELLVKSAAGTSYSLVNNSFEDRDIVWELWSWDGNGVEISNYSARTGSKSVHIIDNNSNGSKWAGLLLNASPNTIYKATAYANIFSGGQSLYIRYYDQNLNLLTTYYQTAWEQDRYQKVMLTTPTSPSSTKYLSLWCYADWYGTSEGFWDDVSITALINKNSIISTEIAALTNSLNSYPNPFNPITTINYSIKDEGYIKIIIYDILGNELTTLVDEYKEPGNYKVFFEGINLTSGVYLCTLQSGTLLLTKKLVLIH
ncbi:MAG: T9SS type A sorting domain-containing protein [Ignavibacteriaceae bacterium]|nr:T9SS type A sorting domain-containing protein [Ignavibacteriaceae bacterium]